MNNVIRRAECPRCGRLYTHLDRQEGCRGPWALNEHALTPWVWVEYVRADDKKPHNSVANGELAFDEGRER